MTAPPWPPAGLAKPAHRALAGARITSLIELSTRTEAEVAALHGMGANGDGDHGAQTPLRTKDWLSGRAD